MTRILNRIAFAALLVFVCIAQVSIIQSYDTAASLLQLPLFLVVIMLYGRLHLLAYAVALFGAYLFDLNSILPFGVYLLSMSVVMAVQLFLQKRVLKQQALHAISIIIVVTTVVYKAMLVATAAMINRTPSFTLEIPSASHLFGELFLLIGAQLFLVAIVNALFVFLNKRYSFKPLSSYGQ